MISAFTIAHLMTVLTTASWSAAAHRERRASPMDWIESFAHSGIRAVGWYFGRDLYTHLGMTTTIALAGGSGVYLYWRRRRTSATTRPLPRGGRRR